MYIYVPLCRQVPVCTITYWYVPSMHWYTQVCAKYTVLVLLVTTPDATSIKNLPMGPKQMGL
jgi:hypothetical protein